MRCCRLRTRHRGGARRGGQSRVDTLVPSLLSATCVSISLFGSESCSLRECDFYAACSGRSISRGRNLGAPHCLRHELTARPKLQALGTSSPKRTDVEGTLPSRRYAVSLSSREIHQQPELELPPNHTTAHPSPHEDTVRVSVTQQPLHSSLESLMPPPTAHGGLAPVSLVLRCSRPPGQSCYGKKMATLADARPSSFTLTERMLHWSATVHAMLHLCAVKPSL